MRKKQVIAWALVLVLLGGGGIAAYLLLQPQKKSTLRFDTVPVDRGPIVAKVTASGTLSALVTVQVGSQVSGRIKELLVDFNSVVTKGQVVARIDPMLFQAAMEQAKANFMAAQGDLVRSQAQAADAERQYQRAKSLAERKLIAQADLDTSQATAEAAKAQVDGNTGRLAQAKASMNQAEINLAYTTITSPINGVVISRSVDVGQTVAASLQAPTLFVIAEDLRKMQVDTSVAEADVGRIQAGMEATFTVDAYPSDVFTGKVREVRNAAQVVQNVVTYDAVVDVANPELKLRPGMTANATFVFAQKDDVLRVPNAALRFHPSPEMLAQVAGPGGHGVRPLGGVKGSPPNAPSPEAKDPPDAAKPGTPGGRTIWIQRQGQAPGQAMPVLITTGITDGTLTEATGDGLREGDLVIVDVLNTGAASGPTGGMGMGMRRGF